MAEQLVLHQPERAPEERHDRRELYGLRDVDVRGDGRLELQAIGSTDQTSCSGAQAPAQGDQRRRDPRRRDEPREPRHRGMAKFGMDSRASAGAPPRVTLNDAAPPRRAIR